MKAHTRIAMTELLAFSLLAGIAVNAEGTSETFGPEKGWLLLKGGKAVLPPVVVQRFLTLAGGPEANIVVITTASEEAITKEQAETVLMGAKNISILNTHDRAVANSDTFVAPLRKAGEGSGSWVGIHPLLWMRISVRLLKRSLRLCCLAAE